METEPQLWFDCVVFVGRVRLALLDPHPIPVLSRKRSSRIDRVGVGGKNPTRRFLSIVIVFVLCGGLLAVVTIENSNLLGHLRMVSLFLSPKFVTPGGVDFVADETNTKEVVSLLEELGSILWKVVTENGRSEARLWLCNTISCINCVRPREQRILFRELLDSSAQRRRIAGQVLQLIIERKPRKAAAILAKKHLMLERFFRGNPTHILQWFGSFATSGKYGHQKGARAISKYAFVNRDICWEELEWKGKHGQSPAMVATKPHYFLDLDVLQTVQNFLENVPEFWSSEELADSLKDGEIFLIDTKFFVDEYIHLIYDSNSADVWSLIDEFLSDEEFSFLCKHLLILLHDTELCDFMLSIGKLCSLRLYSTVSLHVEMSVEEYSPSFWLELFLLTCSSNFLIDELILSNAVINQSRQLLRLVQSDEHIEEKEKVSELLTKIDQTLDEAKHWLLMKECIRMHQLTAVKLLGLESWAIHSCLSFNCKSQDSWTSFFVTNGIGFQRSTAHSLLCQEGSSSDVGCKRDEVRSSKVLRKRKKHRKKYQKKRYHGDRSQPYGDEVLEIISSSTLDRFKSEGCWLISTDNYATAWNNVDLPEHLSRHCFWVWLKWLGSRWLLDPRE